MKWHRANRKIRRRSWIAVNAPSREIKDQAAEWCKQTESTGKFYYHYTNTRWWFEKSDDAILFTLRWGL